MQCLGMVLCLWSEGEFKLKQVQRRAKVDSLLDFISPLDNDGWENIVSLNLGGKKLWEMLFILKSSIGLKTLSINRLLIQIKN